MQATALEEAILKWIAGRQPSLRARLCSAQVVDREHTGAGFYVYLSPDKERDWDHPPVYGPVIESAQLDSGGGCILWFSGGEPHCLEIYAFGNDFPEVLDRFRLSDRGSA
ncbi:MAG: hypothetical protein L6Q95_09720 [Planctomycetes bacterium]|nr:hypothetical protein [Planctomycetota bacterium]